MNAIEKEAWACGTCGHVWTGIGSHDDAEQCCVAPPEECTAWQCAECLTRFPSRAEADACCLPEGEACAILNTPTPAELEAAGQMRLPL